MRQSTIQTTCGLTNASSCQYCHTDVNTGHHNLKLSHAGQTLFTHTTSKISVQKPLAFRTSGRVGGGPGGVFDGASCSCSPSHSIVSCSAVDQSTVYVPRCACSEHATAGATPGAAAASYQLAQQQQCYSARLFFLQ